MGKFFVTVIIIPVLLVLTAGCTRAENEGSQNRVIEITERMFIGQVNNIYINRADYLGKTIKIEGIFIQSEHEGNLLNFVGRNGPNCCGDDGFIGFEVSWDRNREHYPEHDSWVEASGILKEDYQNNYIYLELISLTVLERRGREQVFQ
ncbi:MAG: hypothetical protein FWG89_06265 [Treponema sp.]|nr:hypothetical protein [Treponema sp.]